MIIYTRLTMGPTLIAAIFACLACGSAFTDNEKLVQILQKLQTIEDRLEMVENTNEFKVNFENVFLKIFCLKLFIWTFSCRSPIFAESTNNRRRTRNGWKCKGECPNLLYFAKQFV